jgi:hypothetical protein
MAFLCQAGSATTSTTDQRDLLPLFKEPIEQILGDVKKLYGQGYQGYDDPRIADFTKDQQDYMQKVRDLQGSGQGALDNAMGIYQGVGDYSPDQVGIRGIGSQKFDSQAAQDYMNPYVENVLDRQRERMYRTDDIARQGRDARAVQAGAFGGSRQAVAEAESQRGLQDRIADQEAKALSQAYTQGANIFKSDADRALKGDVVSQQSQLAADKSNQLAGLQNIENQMKSAQGIAGLAQAGQNLTGQQLGLLQGVGGAGQSMNQAGLDLAYQDFQNQKQFPYEQLSFYNQMLQGFPISAFGTSTGSTTRPAPSPFQQGMGLGINALGMYGMGGGFGQAPGGFSMGNLTQNMFPYN